MFEDKFKQCPPEGASYAELDDEDDLVPPAVPIVPKVKQQQQQQALKPKQEVREERVHKWSGDFPTFLFYGFFLPRGDCEAVNSFVT